jgi:hypothetical protein
MSSSSVIGGYSNDATQPLYVKLFFVGWKIRIPIRVTQPVRWSYVNRGSNTNKAMLRTNLNAASMLLVGKFNPLSLVGLPDTKVSISSCEDALRGGEHHSGVVSMQKIRNYHAVWLTAGNPDLVITRTAIDGAIILR